VITRFKRPKRSLRAPIRGVTQELGQGVSSPPARPRVARISPVSWPKQEGQAAERRCSRSTDALRQGEERAEPGGGPEARKQGLPRFRGSTFPMGPGPDAASSWQRQQRPLGRTPRSAHPAQTYLTQWAKSPHAWRWAIAPPPHRFCPLPRASWPWPRRCWRWWMEGRAPKGDVLRWRGWAGDQAAKRTWEPDSPCCHPDRAHDAWRCAIEPSGRWLRTAAWSQRPHAKRRPPGVEMEPSPPFRWPASPLRHGKSAESAMTIGRAPAGESRGTPMAPGPPSRRRGPRA